MNRNDSVAFEPAPDFEGVDAEGRKIRLSSYRGARHVVLVFNRGFL